MSGPIATHTGPEVVGIGEVMGLLDPDGSGPLEDASHFTLRVAGAEANVLITLARLGHRAVLVSAVGDDPVGRLVRRTLEAQEVDTSVRYTDPVAPTGVFFKERLSDGLRRVYYYRDGSAASRLTLGDAKLEHIGTPRVLIVSGLSLGLGWPDGLCAVVRSAVERFSRAGCTVVFDPNLRPGVWEGAQAREDFEQIRGSIDVLVAGREEIAALLPELDVSQAAETLCAEGMRAVVVKAGPEGAVLYDGDAVWPVAPFPVDAVVDPVGAGDAFAAGVVTALLRGWPMLDGVRLGAVLGAKAVTTSGDWEAVPTGQSPELLLDSYLASTPPLEARSS
jgi:2-dehydro-3-deoxygluconokinase